MTKGQPIMKSQPMMKGQAPMGAHIDLLLDGHHLVSVPQLAGIGEARGGKKLLAHELAHVLQQSTARNAPPGQRIVPSQIRVIIMSAVQKTQLSRAAGQTLKLIAKDLHGRTLSAFQGRISRGKPPKAIGQEWTLTLESIKRVGV